jgi:hypothetical protein
MAQPVDPQVANLRLRSEKTLVQVATLRLRSEKT